MSDGNWEVRMMERRSSEPYVEAIQVLQNDAYPLEILKRLNALRSEAILTDIVLCVGSDEIPCHRNVLAVSSPYFKAMFSSGLRENREGRISFNELSSTTLHQLVDYVYTGRLEVTVDNAQDMLAAASLFHYPEVVEFCCRFLGAHLHPSNCLGIEDFSHLHSCDTLEAEAHRFALENFAAVSESEEFLELPVARLVSYVASDLIEVRTEEFVFDAVVKWLSFDRERRSDGFCMAMQHVRFFALDLDHLEKVVSSDVHVASCAACADLVRRAQQSHATIDVGCDSCEDRQQPAVETTFNPRPSTVAKEVMALVGTTMVDGKTVTVLEVYDPQKDRWTTLPDLPLGVSEFSVSAVGNDVFVTGGIRDGHVVGNVWRFASAKRRWCEMPPLLGPRARHASSAWKSNLYVIGGVQSINVHASAVETIECLDLSAGSGAVPAWRNVGLLPCPRVRSHVIPFNATLVEIGGTQCGAVVQTMESYLCTDANVKYSGEQYVLPELIEFSKIAVIDGIFYIVWEDTKKVISLNPEKRTFRRLADMHQTHKNGGASVLNRCIYVAGGAIGNGGASRVVERYDPATDKWTVVKSLNQPSAENICVAIKMC